VPTLAEEQTKGLVLEEIGDGISALTIDLEVIVTADALASLLRGLAGFYKVGVSLDDRTYDPFVAYPPGNVSFQSSDQLLISELIIGTPNKARVVGRSRWINDLHTLVATFVLALTPLAPHDPNVVVVTPPAVSVTSPARDPLRQAELADRLYKNIETQVELENQLRDGRISLSKYVELTASLDKARQDLNAAMSIIRRSGG
jgi:hypothetical protein